MLARIATIGLIAAVLGLSGCVSYAHHDRGGNGHHVHKVYHQDYHYRKAERHDRRADWRAPKGRQQYDRRDWRR
ncbi:hypothetical protein [Stutzerimonas azotifigens]|uniref:hypothetical protein n=1 Tax=Stutzerimonas azotifigens TaxID=291995 RepID=UPI0004261ADB|nr:hypothetical protein [Stutzerimonas azotifigens]